METSNRNSVEKPNGSAFAAVLAAALAFAVLGAVTTLAEVFDGFGSWLAFSGRVGLLSGESNIAIVVYFAAWAGLGFLWRRANPPLRSVVVVSAVLVAIGLLGTFPPFFRLFGAAE